MGSTLTGVPLYRLKGYVEVERIDVPLPNGEALPVVKMVKDAAEVAGCTGVGGVSRTLQVSESKSQCTATLPSRERIFKRWLCGVSSSDPDSVISRSSSSRMPNSPLI